MTDLLGITERGGWRSGGGGAGRQYVRLCYYSLRVGWRHEKEEEKRGRGGGGVAADRKRARRLILQFSYITAPPPSLHLHPSLHPSPPLPPRCQTCRQMKLEIAAASQRLT